MIWILYVGILLCCMVYAITDYNLIKIFHRYGIFMPWIGLIMFTQAALISIPIILFLGE